MPPKRLSISLVSASKINEFIKSNEILYMEDLIKASDKIISMRDVKMVLIAGPSSSGKTTTMKRLKSILKARGYEPIGISTDDFFVDREDTPKNDLGENIVEAGPSTPVEITGLSDNPSAGDKFMAFESEKKAREIAEKRLVQSKANVKKEVVSFEKLFEQMQSGIKEINVVLKCDVRGSEEAVKNALEKIKEKDVSIKVIRSGIGAITESDVILASASNAIIIGFNVIEGDNVKDIAKDKKIDIRLYTIIYKLVEDMKAAMCGMLDPEYEEKIIGEVEVLKIFKFSKVGNIAGCYVTDGIVTSNALARVIRDGIVLASDEKIASLQREKDQAKEVKKGFECGITLEKFNDFKENDKIIVYEMVEVPRG